ncbi:helix-turn-helix domain-containing protein [uncultured Alistipes sp.]|uniref:winged helix-turn-helix transcriptional regulator n=1 Tax=uncultured Alistipes sp. TaxID=538949 RepID=UPI0026702C4A|nr:helix-turn-helix domain-containing protein [uncultured Alistipes sp.]
MAVLYPGCPIRNILSRFCDKWSLLVLHTLHCSGEAPLRFKELQRRIPDISQKMLTVTLRTLEEDGHVKRTVYAGAGQGSRIVHAGKRFAIPVLMVVNSDFIVIFAV